MTPTVIEKKKKYTYEDYLKTPEDERYELIVRRTAQDTDTFHEPPENLRQIEFCP
jgi:hypothetical protein